MDQSYIKSLEFTTYTEEDKTKFGVVKITNSMTVDNLGISVQSGLSDPSLGSSEESEVCTSCSLNGLECPGHFGYIQLALPLYNPVFFSNLITLLKGSCFICHKPYLEESLIEKFIIQRNFLRSGMLAHASEVEDFYSKWRVEIFMSQQYEKYDRDRILVKKLRKYYRANHPNGELPRTIDKSIAEAVQQLIKNFLKEEFLETSGKKCYYCRCPRSRIKHEPGMSISVKFLPLKTFAIEKVDAQMLNDATVKINRFNLKNVHHLTVSDVFQHCVKLYNNFPSFLAAFMGREPSENLIKTFFLEFINVIPPRFRPVAILGSTGKFDNPITGVYRKILSKELLLEKMLTAYHEGGNGLVETVENGVNKRKRPLNTRSNHLTVQEVWDDLQVFINTLYDSKLSKMANETAAGLRQVLEKKEGLFRMHLMGKRVNYSARSVISPDPMLDIDEVGVPIVFAQKLTYNCNITPFNCLDLVEMVKKGPEEHPGASHVEFGKSKIILNSMLKNKNTNTAKRIVSEQSSEDISVRRHLVNRDAVLLNRQPTLHKPSIMAHRVRILPKDRTIRMHYANCKAYNADFDGDEINCHLPQDEMGRSEAINIASCNFQYLSPRDGKPLIGLIQDYMVAGVLMSMQDRFLTLKQYQNIINAALVQTERLILTFPPSIVKPEQYWSGKQIISTIILNCTPPKCPLINMTSKSKITEKFWNHFQPLDDEYMSEDNVIIRQGELLTGIFDKNQFGASAHGLIYNFHELYGGSCAIKLLSVLGRACIALLQYTGFSLGIEDLICQNDANALRRRIIDDSHNNDFVQSQLASVFGHNNDLKSAYKKAHLFRAENVLMNLDNQAKNVANEFQNKINSACSAGSLIKPFPSNSLHMMILSGSKGTAINAMQISGLLGQMELEGRRPPLMISGRSLPCYQQYSCSLQSGGFVESSFLTGLKPSEYFFHCMAGREGLVDTAVKTSRSGYLQRCLVKHMEGIKIAYDHTVRDSDGSIVQFLYGEDGCDVSAIQFAEDNKFEIFSMNSAHMTDVLKFEATSKLFDTKTAPKNMKTVMKELVKAKAEKINGSKKPVVDTSPIISRFHPCRYLGSVTEKYFSSLMGFLDKHTGITIVTGKYNTHQFQTNSSIFKDLMLLKYIRCLVPPGEAVGLLSAQSVGEPSTQMTLNTFHFAGRGEANVTLGIPRLRELFLTGGDSIKTPHIILQVHSDKYARIAAAKLCLKFNPIPLEKLINSVQVHMNFESSSKKKYQYSCSIVIFLQSDTIFKSLGLSLNKVGKYLKNVFLRKISVEILKKDVSDQKLTVVADKAAKGGENMEGVVDDDENVAENTTNNDKTADIGTQEEDNLGFNTKEKYLNKEARKCKFHLFVPASIKRIPIMPIVKNIIGASYINQTKNIKRCIYSENENSAKVIVEGDNIPDFIHYHDIFILKSLYCNNINRVAEFYGIEAARMTLMREISNVFDVYGITVNKRHLSLLADYMTFHGNYRPCNRYGINCNPSPFQKMSFETTTQFLKSACLYNEPESLFSPSSRLVTGLPIAIGTGSFDLLSS